MDVVSNRCESIRSLFRGYISLGSRGIQVQSSLVRCLRSETHLRNAQVNKASSVNNRLAKTCLVVDLVRNN